jgi:hypothetical protein
MYLNIKIHQTHWTVHLKNFNVDVDIAIENSQPCRSHSLGNLTVLFLMWWWKQNKYCENVMQALPNKNSDSLLWKLFCFATTGVYINAPSIYFQGTYGQSIKFAKKPRTLFWRIFARIEKLNFLVQLLNTM